MAGSPKNPEFATSFSDWVFEQTFPEAAKRRANVGGEAETRARGALAHQAVIGSICKSEELRHKFLASALSPGAFRIVYADSGASQETLLASNLQVAGRAMRCRPDLVLCHKRSGIHIVVEYKFSFVRTASIQRRDGTRREFDHGGYPNNRAQLWAYSKIDDFQDVARLLLVLQFRDPESLRVKYEKLWTCPDEQLDREGSAHFEKYRSWINAGYERTPPG